MANLGDGIGVVNPGTFMYGTQGGCSVVSIGCDCCGGWAGIAAACAGIGLLTSAGVWIARWCRSWAIGPGGEWIALRSNRGTWK